MLFLETHSRKVYEGTEGDILSVLNPSNSSFYDVSLIPVKPIKISKQYADTFRLLDEKKQELHEQMHSLQELENTLYKQLVQN
jgi:hypothetical protein